MPVFQKSLDQIRNTRLFYAILLALVFLALYSYRFVNIGADFPIVYDEHMARDGVFYTDEGWYAINPISWYRHGTFYMEGEMNFVVPLPVQQFLHLPSFAIFGPTITAVRVTTLVCFLILLVLVFLMTMEWSGKFAAMAAMAMMLTNYQGFFYSRTGLSEFPMSMFIFAGFICALKSQSARWGWLCTVGAAILFTLGLFTKTTALPAVATTGFLFLVAHWQKTGYSRYGLLKTDWWKKAALFAFIVAAITIPYKLYIRIYFPNEVVFFKSINADMHLDFNMYNIYQRAAGLTSDIRNIFRIFRYAFLYIIPFAFIFLKPLREHPLMIAMVTFIAGYTSVLMVYDNPQPRYWMPYIPAGSVIIGVILQEMVVRVKNDRRWAIGVTIWCVAMLGSMGRNLSWIITTMNKPQYTFQTMTDRINELIYETSGKDPYETYLMGHYSHSISLHGGPKPINDLYASWPLEFRLDKFNPEYLITQGELDLETVVYNVMRPYHKNPADYSGRQRLIRERYDVERLAVFSVLGNYEEDATYFYRLHPKGTLNQ